jgi:hypothetical protein
MTTTITLGSRELATVLAALRYWQREGLMSAGAEQDIATEGGAFRALPSYKIDDLCGRLNCGAPCAPDKALELVRTIARFTKPGRTPDDDRDTIQSLINRARAIVKGT